jgi:hypothetical protein
VRRSVFHIIRNGWSGRLFFCFSEVIMPLLPPLGLIYYSATAGKRFGLDSRHSLGWPTAAGLRLYSTTQSFHIIPRYRTVLKRRLTVAQQEYHSSRATPSETLKLRNYLVKIVSAFCCAQDSCDSIVLRSICRRGVHRSLVVYILVSQPNI